MRGTWQTTDSGGGAGVLLVAGIVVLLAASGAASAIADMVVAVLIGAVVVTVLLAAGLATFLVCRARRGLRGPLVRDFAPPVVHRLPGPERSAAAVPGPERPAIGAPASRELHLHFHGVDAEQVAAILRDHEQQ